MTKRKVIQKL